MSESPVNYRPAPLRIDLIAWSGAPDELAARLRISTEDIARLIRQHGTKSGNRVTLRVALANQGVVDSAVKRLMARKIQEV